MHKLPVLLAYLNGMPDVESTYPVLARLHQRGRIAVRAIVYSKLLRKEPRLRTAFQKFGFMPETGSKLSMKLLYQKDIRDADAILTIADPYRDTTTRKQRGAYIRKIGKKSVFLQHGAYQLGVNGTLDGKKMNYYSDKLLFWEPAGINHALFTPGVANRISVVGFTKKNVLTPRDWGPEVQAWKAKYPRRLLICQSFRWGNGRYDSQDISHFYNLIKEITRKNPDLGIIVRSHRGKVRRNHRSYDRDLTAKYDNVLLSQYYSGPLARTTIQDVLGLCHAILSPTSTTVLDSIYAGKPAAVFAERLNIFSELPQIDSVDALQAFLTQIEAPGPEQERIRKRFGDLENNLDRAAAEIESVLLS